MGNRFSSAIIRCLLLLVIVLPAPAAAPDHTSGACDRLERSMDRTRAQLRRGGSAAQQARARARMRRLKSRYYRRCRGGDR